MGWIVMISLEITAKEKTADFNIAGTVLGIKKLNQRIIKTNYKKGNKINI
jgi:hypothetical protein